MFPRDAARMTITVYNYFLLDELHYTYKKTILHDCIWRLDKSAKNKSQGTVNEEVTKLLIPYDYEYFSTQNGEIFEGNGWTVQMGPELVGSYIVQGECQFEFPQTRVEPNDFFTKYVMSFEKLIRYERPKKVIEEFIGSRNMWYLEVGL